MGNSSFPALTDYPALRYINFIALYFAQGIPEGMIFFGIPAWMAMNNKTPSEIAALAVAGGLPWSFKFIVAPLMDRYTFLAMGRKRPWVLIGQLGLILSFISMAFIPDPLNNMNLLMLGAFTVSFFGSFQDVATDGMAIDIIPSAEQARANGFMWGAKTTGISASLAVGTWILNHYNYKYAILLLAATIGLTMLAPLFFRERKGEKILPWSKGEASENSKKIQLDNWKELLTSLLKVFRLKYSLLFTIIIFINQGAFNYLSTVLPIFTVQELHWNNAMYAEYYATGKLIGGIIGMLVGGFLIDKFGRVLMMNIYFLFLIFGTIALSYLNKFWFYENFIFGFMIAYNILFTFSCIGIFAIAMMFCWKKVSASQFTLYMTLSNLGRIALASLVGPITANYSWQISLLSFSIMLGISFILFQFLNYDKHLQEIEKLEHLDAKHE
ncbi:MAG TPA: MFS transporter [Bacteroidia bacterium]|nr:MFS transporter [Bacteroidia bacterium]